MIVSDSHRFICFQPWKVGSSTLYARLGNYDSGRYPQNKHFNEFLGKYIHKHVALDDFVRLPESRERYYCFTFVRNPYDRIYSGFLQRRWRLTADRDYYQKHPSHAAELKYIEHGFGPFLDFYSEYFKQEGKLMGHHQHEYIYHEDKRMVDFVGHMETFEKSFAQVCATVGIEDVANVNANVRVKDRTQPNVSSSGSTMYRYIKEFDAGSIRATNEIYARDFELLGYRVLDPELFRDTSRWPTGLSPFK